MLKLDFTIVSSTDRSELVNDFFTQNPTYKPTAHELETITNYILYGKDPDGTSIVDRKEINIDTKYGSYKKRQPESLDGLIETPGFNENTICKKDIYKKIKPTIDRTIDSNIPGMAELWKVIDRTAAIIDTYAGKIEWPYEGPLPEYTTQQLYQLKHHLIDMRRQQYYLKDVFCPTEFRYSANVHKQVTIEQESVNWEQFEFYPLGLYCGDVVRFTNPRMDSKKLTYWDRHQELDGRPSIDFTNPEHIYLLIKQYQDLRIQADQDVESTAGALIKTLDFYIERAKLDEVRLIILKGKLMQQQNDQISVELLEIGVTHSENYISTIFKKNVCNDIAAAARLNYDEFLARDSDDMWKKCSCCGEWKLRDTREYMRKNKSSDGFAGKCKKCEKVSRNK